MLEECSQISAIDVYKRQQPASPTGDVLVMITGDLLIDDEQNAQRFSQVFHLMPEGNSYYVYNDIFRLNSVSYTHLDVYKRQGMLRLVTVSLTFLLTLFSSNDSRSSSLKSLKSAMRLEPRFSQSPLNKQIILSELCYGFIHFTRHNIY